MKFSTAISLVLAAEAVNAAALQPRHYTFPSTGGAAWSTVRQTLNYQSNGPVTDVSSDSIRCYTSSGTRAPQTQSVAAGGSVSFTASPNIFHPGPLQFYLAKVPSGQTAATWEGTGNVWFKIYAEPAKISGGQLSWDSLNKASVSVTIPKNTPSGDYLLRVEHIALHSASNLNGAQIYLSCAQITVTGGGSGSPSPLVAFPGAYKNTDPGLKVNIYSGATSYTPPGPAVWSG
ncbi:hypothetical protein EK21DRAFT_97466 [Setomelanomma holmii]|uniref:lytic cellulose monooxygenase (C4-dehydrogenating) n=1 Tax=Setomelanomma holmii TaxID=210430 RepID=A0A9P4HG44_9PLEO|nr:hypothetical protein EK21DRAFT_97466 [Setomelanomma holmii]